MAQRMPPTEAAFYILKIWTDERLGPEDFHASEVMLRLVMLGFPCTVRGVLSVARAYCDSQTENNLYRGKDRR